MFSAVLGLIEQLLHHAKGTARNQLLDLGSRYAEFAGWINQDFGQAGPAAYWSDRALEWAHQAADPVMVSYVLMRKSNQASDERHVGDIIGLAEAALQVGMPLPRQIEALALRQKAHGHALDGDEAACHKSLDRAAKLAAQAEGDDDGRPGGYCTESYVEAHRATFWLELGHPRRAIESFEHQLANWPAKQRRDKGIFVSRLAVCHADAGEPEPAATRAAEAIGILRTTGSARIARELCRLRPKLHNWRGHPDIGLVCDALAQLERGIPQ